MVGPPVGSRVGDRNQIGDYSGDNNLFGDAAFRRHGYTATSWSQDSSVTRQETPPSGEVGFTGPEVAGDTLYIYLHFMLQFACFS